MTSAPCRSTRRIGRPLALTFAASVAAAAAGCGTMGGVGIDFELPTRTALSPVDARLAAITLVATAPDGTETTTTQTVTDPEQGLRIGSLPATGAMSLAVELRSPTQRLIGYGRSPGSVSVRSGRTATVAMKVRKPFVYVAGGASLAAFDASLDGGASGFQSDIPLPAKPVAAATTPDGGDIAIATSGAAGNQLVLVSTATHQVTNRVPIPAGGGAPVDVAVSPDGRYAAVAQGGGSGGVTVVDLAAARAGSKKTFFIPLGPTGAVAMATGSGGSGRMYALVNRSFAVGCDSSATPSKIAVVSLDSPDTPSLLSYDGSLHDLAVSGDGGALVGADACRGELRRIDPTTGDAAPLVALDGASAVAVYADRVWGGGAKAATANAGARVELVSVDIGGGGATRVLLPALQEHALSLDYSQKGQGLEQSLDADQVSVTDLAVVPGAEHLALIVHAHHHAAAINDQLLGLPVVPEMDLDSDEYLLVDASTTALTQRVRTYCDLTWQRKPTPALDNWTCGDSSGQTAVPSDEQYVPAQAVPLFGTR